MFPKSTIWAVFINPCIDTCQLIQYFPTTFLVTLVALTATKFSFQPKMIARHGWSGMKPLMTSAQNADPSVRMTQEASDPRFGIPTVPTILLCP